MDGVALVLLTLVAYSSGAVIGGRGRMVFPGLPDVAAVLALWVGGLLARSLVDNKWLLIAACCLAAGLLAWAWTRARPGQAQAKTRAAPPAVAAGGQPLFKRAWAAWISFAQRLGNFQGRVLLALFYFVLVMPFAALARLSGDPLHLRPRSPRSFWLPRPAGNEPPDVEAMRSQF